MKSEINIFKTIGMLSVALLLVAFTMPHPHYTVTANDNNGLMVIANIQNTVSELNKKQLKGILKGEVVRWPDKKKVILALMKSSTNTGKLVASKILNMSPDDMDQFYLSMVFQGKMEAPKTFETAEDLKQFVAATPGAIGIADDALNTGNIKTIKIDGLNKLAF